MENRVAPLLSIVIAFAFSGCASGQRADYQKYEKGLKRASAGSSLALKAGEAFCVDLEENPSTGYAWTYALPLDVEYLEDKAFALSAAPPPGAPLRHVWKFRRKGGAGTVLIFTLVRPGDLDSVADTKTFGID